MLGAKNWQDCGHTVGKMVSTDKLTVVVAAIAAAYKSSHRWSESGQVVVTQLGTMEYLAHTDGAVPSVLENLRERCEVAP
jgi:hypothetical protein